MKKRILLIWVVLLAPLVLLAQGQGRRFDEYFEKYKAEKVAFLTQKLNLEVGEAEKFWPVYNEYQTKREKLMVESRPRMRRPDPDSLNDGQMKELMDTKIENELKMAKLAADYHEKFKAILPVKKLFILYHAEQEFMGHMIQRMRESSDSEGRQGGRRGGGGQ